LLVEEISSSSSCYQDAPKYARPILFGCAFFLIRGRERVYNIYGGGQEEKLVMWFATTTDECVATFAQRNNMVGEDLLLALIVAKYDFACACYHLAAVSLPSSLVVEGIVFTSVRIELVS